MVGLMAYHDDVHIAAWRAEEYSPAAIRTASFLYMLNEAATVDSILKSPLFYDEAYVRGALEELRQRGDLLDTGVGSALTAKGVMRRERVESLTDDAFDLPFEGWLSDLGRKDWTMLMTGLVDVSRTTKSLT